MPSYAWGRCPPVPGRCVPTQTPAMTAASRVSAVADRIRADFFRRVGLEEQIVTRTTELYVEIYGERA